MNYCKNCGENINPEKKFCGSCGTHTGAEVSDPKGRDHLENNKSQANLGSSLLSENLSSKGFLLDTVSQIVEFTFGVEPPLEEMLPNSESNDIRKAIRFMKDRCLKLERNGMILGGILGGSFGFVWFFSFWVWLVLGIRSNDNFFYFSGFVLWFAMLFFGSLAGGICGKELAFHAAMKIQFLHYLSQMEKNTRETSAFLLGNLDEVKTQQTTVENIATGDQKNTSQPVLEVKKPDVPVK